MTVSSTIGPISGINYGQLITALSSYEQQPIDDINTRLKTISSQSTALTDLTTQMTALKLSAASFTSPAIFAATSATSINPSVASATAGIGTPVGAYNFAVQRLASASQSVSPGYADAYNTALNLTGTVTIQSGKNRLDQAAQLRTLNGGNGIARGSIRLTDGAGHSTLLDLSKAVDINDIITALNSTTGADVSAKVDGDHLVLTDNSGGTGKLAVANVGGTTTASDLGLAGSATGALTGTSLTKLQGTTSLDALNNGNGVRTAGSVNDFSITAGSSTFQVSLSGAKTFNDVINKINSATGNTTVRAALSADGHGLTLTDSGGGPVSVAAQNGSFAAYDLGLQTGTAAGATFTGDRLTGDLNSPLLSQLRGGNEGASSTLPQYGTISLNGTSVDLSAARTLNDVIAGINNSSAGVTAQLNNAGNGLTLSSAGPTIIASDVSGNLASFLQLSGSSIVNATGSALDSGDLRLRYISSNTLLSTLNGGNGVRLGKIQINDGAKTQVLDLSTPDIKTMGSVINKINNSGLAVTARINDTGDGILLTQTGTGKASVTESGGQTASDLGLLGSFAGGQLDGSLQKSVTILATDKLSDIANKLNSAGAGIAVSVITDGSGSTPYRLSISSRNSGNAARFTLDGSAIGLNTTSIVQGQDAVVVYGGNANGTGGLVTTSASNSISGLVPSLSVNLLGVGNTTVNVASDTSQISTTVQSFVDNYNKVLGTITTDTTFDPNTPANNGVLFGDNTVRQVQDALGSFIGQVYTGTGSKYQSLTAIGLTIQQDGTLQLDANKLQSVLATNAADIKTLFTTNKAAVKADITAHPPVAGAPAIKGIGATLSDLIDRFTNAQTGILFGATDALATQTTQLNSRSKDLQALLVMKKNQLVQTFANLEMTISSLQQQGTSITNLSNSTAASSSTKTS